MSKTSRAIFTIAAMFMLLLQPYAPASSADGMYAWVQLAPLDKDGKPVMDIPGKPERYMDGTLGRILRVVIPHHNVCPEIRVDGHMVRLRDRPVPETHAAAFPVTICEHLLQPGEDGRFADWALPQVPQDPRRILVIGDTGCRHKEGGEIQDCKPDTWPFEALAAAAAAMKPDLIIHVGDLHYREIDCPGGGADCGGVISGYNFPAWQADFFAPAQALLKVAPWVLVRGNHEACGRARTGWRLFFSLQSIGGELPECSPDVLDDAEPYRLKFDSDLRLWVIDTASWNRKLNEIENQRFEGLYQTWLGYIAAADAINEARAAATWILMHHPLWFFPFDSQFDPQAQIQEAGSYGFAMNTLREGLLSTGRTSSRSGPEIVLSGHIHILELLRGAPKKGLPWQLISGGGGTDLDTHVNSFKHMDNVPEQPLRLDGSEGLVSGKVAFGFMMLRRVETSWQADLYDNKGDLFRSCDLTPDGDCSTK